jgi:hypothetical protein
MNRLLAALLLMLAWPSAGSAARDLPYGPTLSFAVYRNGEQIGQHTLTFRRNGPELTVDVSIDFAVKFLGFTAYRYSHQAREVWADDALQSLAAQTDDNGRKHVVRARRDPDGLAVEHDGRRDVLPANLLPSSHWNVHQVEQSTILNTQLGIPARVTIVPVGREMVRTSSGAVPATRYRYTGDVTKDQWFDDRGRWVRTNFKASDGSSIEYILQE